MAEILDTLVTKMTVDNKDFNRALYEIRERFQSLKYTVKDASDSVSINTDKMTASVSRFAKRFISIAAIIGESRTVFNQALQVERLSRSLNVNAQDLQAWMNIIKKDGGSADGFANSVKKLSNNLNMIPLQGNSPLLVNLTRLGINARGAGGGMKSALQVMLELSDRMKGMSSVQAMSIGKMFGLDENTVRILQKGRKEVTAMLAANKKLGVYNTEFIKKVDKLNRSWQDLKQSFHYIASEILSLVIPALQYCIDGIIGLIDSVKNASGVWESLGIATGIALLINLKTAIAGVAKALSLLNTVFKASPIGRFITLILMLTTAIQDLWAFFKGEDSVTGRISDWVADKLSNSEMFNAWQYFRENPQTEPVDGYRAYKAEAQRAREAVKNYNINSKIVIEKADIITNATDAQGLKQGIEQNLVNQANQGGN